MPDSISLGDIVQGTVTSIDEDGIQLDVNGIVGTITAGELPLAAGEAPADRYALGDSVEAFLYRRRDDRPLDLSIRRAAPGYAETLAVRELGEIVNGTIIRVEEDSIWLDVDGAASQVGPSELPLMGNETLADRYLIGASVQAFVRYIDLDTRFLGCSVLRATPGYADILGTLNTGETINGTVMSVQSDRLLLDLNGLPDWIGEDELPLSAGEAPADRYSVGDVVAVLVANVHDMFQWSPLDCSVRRAMPGYENALNALNKGDTASATIISADDNRVVLDINGVRDVVRERELPLAPGEIPSDRYSVGETVDALIISVDHDVLSPSPINCSALRASPGYEDALQALDKRVTVSATVMSVRDGGNFSGVILDVNGVRSLVGKSELPLAPGEKISDRYSANETVDALVTDVNHDILHWKPLDCSVRRALPGYEATLNALNKGDTASATIISADDNRVVLDINGVRDVVRERELPLAPGEIPSDRYSVGETVDALIISVDHDVLSPSPINCSVLRASPGYEDALQALYMGAIVEATILSAESYELNLDINGVHASVDEDELPLAPGETPTDHYSVGETVDALVTDVDRDIFDFRPLTCSVRRALPGYETTLNALNKGDIVKATILSVASSRLNLDINGVHASVNEDELPLAPGETPADRYSAGETVDALVRDVDRDIFDSRPLTCSVRRALPGYETTFNALNKGDIVKATILSIESSELNLDINGVHASVDEDELPLAPGEKPSDRYSAGETVDALVTDIARDIFAYSNSLRCSVRRASSDYKDALLGLNVGDIVKATILSVESHHWNFELNLDINGVHAPVGEGELPLAPGETPADRYSAGETVDVLVTSVDRDIFESKPLSCSVRRASSDYRVARDVLKVGDILNGVVVKISESHLILNAHDMRFQIDAWDVPLSDDETLSDRYSVKDIVRMRVSRIDSRPTDQRDSLYGSVRRALDPDPLARFSPGGKIEGFITSIDRWYDGSTRGFYLEINGMIGYVEESDLPLFNNESCDNRYAVGDAVLAVVKNINSRETYHFAASARGAMYIRRGGSAPPKLGDLITGTIISVRERGIDLDVNGLIGWIPAGELSLDRDERPTDKYATGDHIEARVCGIDLSHRRFNTRQALMLSVRRVDGWTEALERLQPGTVVSDAQVLPSTYLPEDERRAIVDLGPVIGFISVDDFDSNDSARWMEEHVNTSIGVSIESIDANGLPIVSENRFRTRWRELVAELEEGSEATAELRTIEHDLAFVDLGFGLSATIPTEQIPATDKADESLAGQTRKTIQVRVISIDEDNHRITVERHDYQLERELEYGETAKIEFKATLRTPIKTKNYDEVSDKKRLQAPIQDSAIRAIASFLNTDGGVLCIGIDENGSPLDDVVAKDKFKDEDEMLQHLATLVNAQIGKHVWDNVKSSFENYHGKRILVVRCTQSNRPIYTVKKTDRSKVFYIRSVATSGELDIEDVTPYINDHFRNTGP